jgi:hypothetical protein
MNPSAPTAMLLVAAALLCPQAAFAGFRTPQSLVQNLYAFYGDGSPDYSRGLPHDEATARRFFHGSLVRGWVDLAPLPFDFLVQATSWKIGPVAITGTIRQFDRTYVRVAFTNRDRPVALNIVIQQSDDGWVISDVESTHDSLVGFLLRLRSERPKPKRSKPVRMNRVRRLTPFISLKAGMQERSQRALRGLARAGSPLPRGRAVQGYPIQFGVATTGWRTGQHRRSCQSDCYRRRRSADRNGCSSSPGR